LNLNEFFRLRSTPGRAHSAQAAHSIAKTTQGVEVMKDFSVGLFSAGAPGRKIALGIFAAVAAGVTGCGGHSNPDCPNMAIAVGLIGQANYDVGTANTGGESNLTLNQPLGSVAASSATGTLYVDDSSNMRVLGYSAIPTGIAGQASFVLGQEAFDSDNAWSLTSPSSYVGLNLPGKAAVSTDGEQFIVADTSNNRVLIWNSMPTSDAATPDIVIGQSNVGPAGTLASGAAYAANSFYAGMENTGTNQGGTLPAANTLSNPTSAIIAGSGNSKRLIIVDQGNNRVLIWKWSTVTAAVASATVPQFPNVAADAELGQNATVNVNTGATETCSASDPYCFTTNVAAIDAYTSVTATEILAMNTPTDAWSNGDVLYVSDSANNRVLYWPNVPLTNNDLAEYVIGQTTFGVDAVGSGSQHMTAPQGIFNDGAYLYVADYGNNRVLVFSGLKAQQNGPTASGVFGQQDFTHTAYNDDDQNGQPGDQQNSQTNLNPTFNTLYEPSAVYAINGNLYVTDTGNNRIMVYTSSSYVNGTYTNNCNGVNPQTSG
jgi:hypothetical protein